MTCVFLRREGAFYYAKSSGQVLILSRRSLILMFAHVGKKMLLLIGYPAVQKTKQFETILEKCPVRNANQNNTPDHLLSSS